jgi:hypothetical protein
MNNGDQSIMDCRIREQELGCVDVGDNQADRLYNTIEQSLADLDVKCGVLESEESTELYDKDVVYDKIQKTLDQINAEANVRYRSGDIQALSITSLRLEYALDIGGGLINLLGSLVYALEN